MNDLFAWSAQQCPASLDGEWTPIEKGGSDRKFWRGSGTASGFVAVAYGREKPENARYADCTMFLRQLGVNVPNILAHDETKGFMLLEDAGTEDLWKFRDEAWSVRRELYIKTLEQAARMHAADLESAARSEVLQAPFDMSLYRWEQDYFFTHLLDMESPKATGLRDSLPLNSQAEMLARLPRVLLHRDFQSQNIIVHAGDISLIDFQGMRAGLAGYDVASLLYDPYVTLSAEEIDELSSTYTKLSCRPYDSSWHDEFHACARQRLMQALGAYGFLGRTKGKPQFLKHIPAAATRLAGLCESAHGWEPLVPILRTIASKNS